MENFTAVMVANIAYCLKLRRVQLRMTLQEVEEKFGIKVSALSRLETGKQFFTFKTIMPLVVFYALRVTDIFKDYKEKPTRRDLQHLDALETEMLRCKKSKGYRKLRKQVQLELKF